MEAILRKLLSLSENNHLEVEGVTLSNAGYDIEIGQDNEKFDGEIKLRVKYNGNVIDLGNELSGALKE